MYIIAKSGDLCSDMIAEHLHHGRDLEAEIESLVTFSDLTEKFHDLSSPDSGWMNQEFNCRRETADTDSKRLHGFL